MSLSLRQEHYQELFGHIKALDRRIDGLREDVKLWKVDQANRRAIQDNLPERQREELQRTADALGAERHHSQRLQERLNEARQLVAKLQRDVEGLEGVRDGYIMENNDLRAQLKNARDRWQRESKVIKQAAEDIPTELVEF